MRYLNFELDIKQDRIRIKEPDAFIPSHIFDNGQCFRWNRIDDEWYIGVVGDRIAEVKKVGLDIDLINIDFDTFKHFWYHYFDLGTDYEAIKKIIAVDSFTKAAVEYGSGMRILRQDFFEVLLSFIASQNNNIPRIKKIIEGICKSFGRKLVYKGEVFYAFPRREEFIDIDESLLEYCKAGYRCSYFKSLSTKKLPVSSSFEGIDLKQQEEVLHKIDGVGPKVANCVLLFSGINTTAFPIDTWVKKIFSKIYGLDKSKDIYEFAVRSFGAYAGIAQQYLFYWARSINF